MALGILKQDPIFYLLQGDYNSNPLVTEFGLIRASSCRVGKASSFFSGASNRNLQRFQQLKAWSRV